jgi:hypothetical protein
MAETDTDTEQDEKKSPGWFARATDWLAQPGVPNPSTEPIRVPSGNPPPPARDRWWQDVTAPAAAPEPTSAPTPTPAPAPPSSDQGPAMPSPAALAEYGPMVSAFSKASGIPEGALWATILGESGPWTNAGKPTPRGKAGEVGPAQLNPTYHPTAPAMSDKENVWEGMLALQKMVQQHGLEKGLARYMGTGPKAEARGRDRVAAMNAYEAQRAPAGGAEPGEAGGADVAGTTLPAFTFPSPAADGEPPPTTPTLRAPKEFTFPAPTAPTAPTAAGPDERATGGPEAALPDAAVGPDERATAAPEPPGPALPEPKTMRGPTPDLETPEGGWDPTATDPNAARARAAYRALARQQAQAPDPMAVASARALQNMERQEQYQAKLEAARQEATAAVRERSQKLVAEVEGARNDLVGYLERTRQPVPPELQKTPKAPDVTIRPWLDPEGKNAISVIAQTLGMLAVGAAGAYNKTPLTAMQYFREAAEAWRRDEVDTANSKLKQFEMAVTSIKNDNDVALKQYELADKQYAHNLDAKKAMMVVKMDGLNLNEKALDLMNKPYEEARQASKAQFEMSSKILDELTKYRKVDATLGKNRGNLPKNEIGARAIMAHTRAELAKLAPEDTEQRTLLEREYTQAKEVVDGIHAAKAQDNVQNLANANANKQIGESQKALMLGDAAAGQLNRLAQFYAVLEEYHALPSDQTSAQAWLATFRKNLAAQPLPVQAAWQGVEQFFAPTVIGMERTFFDDKGTRSKEAFGNLKKTIMSYPAAMQVIDSLKGTIEDHVEIHKRRIEEQEAFLQTAPQRVYQAPGLPAAAEPAESEED